MNVIALLLQIGFFLIAGLAAAGAQPVPDNAGNAGGVKFTKHFNNSIFRITEKEFFSVEILTGEKELKMLGKNSSGIIIHNNEDEDVEDADITVTARSAEAGHDAVQKLPLTEKGAGLYVLEGAVLQANGLRELRVALRKDGRDDTAVFFFPDALRESLSAGKYDAAYLKGLAEKRSFDDVSATRLSKKGSLRVTYSSESGAVPLVKVHNWKIKVDTAEGRPVNGAEITIEGRMSEHGHGLPAKPFVTKDLGNGNYVAEGMKFNMSGMWEVTLNIKAGDISDSVVFNVSVE